MGVPGAIVEELTRESAGTSRPGRRTGPAVLWAGALGAAVLLHACLGWVWLARPLPALGGGQIATASYDLDLIGEAPMERAAAAPELPVASEAPEPEPELAGSSPSEASDPPPVTHAVPMPIVPPAPAPLPERRASPRSAAGQKTLRSSGERHRATKPSRRQEAPARRRAGTAPSRLAALSSNGPSGADRTAPSRAGSGGSPAGASAAASAAWRNQVVGILRGRFAGGSSGGMASFTFSVDRGGGISGARLTSSSGNSRLDAAGLAVFRGSVPPPPAGYAGPLTFNIRLGVR